MTRIDELLKFKMTGRGWLENIINTWLNDKNGSRVMTLYADPGAGKSLFRHISNLQTRTSSLHLPATAEARNTAKRTKSPIALPTLSP